MSTAAAIIGTEACFSMRPPQRPGQGAPMGRPGQGAPMGRPAFGGGEEAHRPGVPAVAKDAVGVDILL